MLSSLRRYIYWVHGRIPCWGKIPTPLYWRGLAAAGLYPLIQYWCPTEKQRSDKEEIQKLSEEADNE
ncbi:hypothetical protein J6590_049916 [Homalodisca vitripennis]|nr:hypothetical protein J6590_049916 [Homalodisca vitripennis]